MENKEFKGMVSALEKVSGEQKRVTGLLLEKLEIITGSLIKILENHDMEKDIGIFDFRGYGFRNKGSQLGHYIHFCKIGNDDYSESIGILPSKTSEIGCNFYYHNDVNALTEYMTRYDVIWACKLLPEFIQHMMLEIQELTEEEQGYLEKYSNLE